MSTLTTAPVFQLLACTTYGTIYQQLVFAGLEPGEARAIFNRHEIVARYDGAIVESVMLAALLDYEQQVGWDAAREYVEQFADALGAEAFRRACHRARTEF